MCVRVCVCVCACVYACVGVCGLRDLHQLLITYLKNALVRPSLLVLPPKPHCKMLLPFHSLTNLTQ